MSSLPPGGISTSSINMSLARNTRGAPRPLHYRRPTLNFLRRTGPASATTYQRHVLQILTFAFEPELTDGKLEEATHLGTERRDILFTNESQGSFWQYVREHHDAFLQIFECKNTAALAPGDLNQSATYLGARLGTFGIIVTREPASQEVLRKSYS